MSMAQQGKLAVVATVILWSTGNTIVRGTDLTGPQIAFWRYLISAVIYAVAYRRFVGRLYWADFKVAAPVGVVLAIEVAIFFLAIQSTTVANVTVIGSLSPLLLFGIAARRFKERISRRIVAAAVVALIGVAAVVFGSADGATWSLKGDALAVIALLFFAAYFVVGKVARESLSGVALQVHSLIAGVPVLAVLFLIDSGGMPAPSGGQWWWVIGLVIFPTTGHFLVNWAHAHVTLTLVSLMTLGVPVLSILAAAILYDESLVAAQVVGIIVVLAMLSFAIVETSRLEVDDTEADEIVEVAT